MKQKTIIFLLLFVFVILVGSLFAYFKLFKKAKDVHYHAGFQVYVDGKLQDFSGAKYMLVKPCGKEEKGQEEDEQLEKAHLHDGVGDVVHVEAEGAKWKDLFQNINFNISDKKQITGYVNRKKIENILDYPIKSYDSVVIFIGKADEKLLKNSVTKKRIIEVEKENRNC
ncbi:hypothetical protein A3A46_01080 [Candidatus Roizmanbacteria bacterium RIFCSPLOWO2_01_FULL_37_13]|uniref:Uncharacterized protein n=1 Tax=Candidatus Roizmanbacteria bacterium RIFCSPHIGHO2_02_FULL_38_11 TaxID=1802039 RepID=A0A1F7GXZ5_9BACT|nr:MAG: hypothetical protein A3C25_05540 [Candidatus Roizmanbacteria bacterium RIFCSPHIGHO2_02_FULL_38_11]OGK33081.1 MAG: hypothetical protein A3F58_00250 [Candidatus Roizmanbacteria bacterium RIFCSPHIGHO2_12_FULL_37_9b]OGK41281.1 MAG: hypothetical protein A3A46_01080 [Candidatus Roizmanbacteria bacterium RIFCSPLOWO2_01_FULL_37_13]